MNIEELILSEDPKAALVLRALAVRIAGLLGMNRWLKGSVKDAVPELRASRDRRQAEFELRCELQGWHTSDGSQAQTKLYAVRIDQMLVEPQRYYVGPFDPVPWVAKMSNRGNVPVYHALEATNMANAMAEADRRWPCPDWWTRFFVEDLL